MKSGQYALQGTKAQPADLSVGFDAPNEMFHEPRYDLTISIGSGQDHKTVYLGFLMDGQFLNPARELVEYKTSRRDGMTVTSDEPAIQQSLDHLALQIKHSGPRDYSIALTLFDAQDRVLSEYFEKITEAPGVESKEVSPTGPSSLFQWISTRASY